MQKENRIVRRSELEKVSLDAIRDLVVGTFLEMYEKALVV